MLRSNKLLIDKYCPMCKMYAAGFVKAGCIEPSTIAPYQTVPADILGDTNLERAKTEIALHDTLTGKTRYGVDAMIHIVSHSYPILNRLLRSFLVYSILRFVYKFITYNRRVIYPCQEIETDRKCIPARHRGFRLLLIFLSIGLLIGAAYPIHAFLGIATMHWYLVIGIVYTVLLLMGVSDDQDLNQRMDLWGNMATVGIMGASGIWLLYFLITTGGLSIIMGQIFLGGLLVLLILEGRRRMGIIASNE